MDLSDYILVAAALAGSALVLAVVTWSSPKKPGPSKKKTGSRWKRFRILPSPLHGLLAEASQVVSEESGDLKLHAEARPTESRVRMTGDGGAPRIEVQRKWSPFRRRFRVLLQKKEWFQLQVPKGGQRDINLKCSPDAGSYELRGAPAEREYEILKSGKLAATVSWQRDTKEKETKKKEYVLETVKTEDPLPLLTIALSVEIALGQI